ncbi:MAG TPA: hypothetical protein PLV92_00950 [Pirellulaceae bacterium]|nr:hypothetical protein [Pirellulaceae bacterium]
MVARWKDRSGTAAWSCGGGMRLSGGWLGATALFVALLIGATELAQAAPPTADQREEARTLSVALTRAGNLFKEGKFKESADAVKDVQSKVEKLATTGGRDVMPLIEPLVGKLERAHALLELEGIELPPLKKMADLAAAAAKPAETKPAAGKPAAGGVPAGEVSFVTHVVPVLVGKCGRCHVQDARGRFSMSDFATLMKGPTEGKVIFPGDASGSRIIEVIESGDMPRGGLKVTPDELATVKKWINEGAKFDGKSDKDPLSSLNPNAKPADAPKIEVMEATGKETVSFARDIAPVIAQNCTNCHGNMRPRENFALITFERLLRGGDGGPPIVPGKPDESLLIKKLKGTGGGQRMPQGREPLSTDVIAKFEKWIAEGAKFDGGDPKSEVAVVAALARAKGATHEQLTADRAKLAGENWRMGMPGIQAVQFESDNFLVLGNVGENTLKDIGERAESMAPKVAGLFKIPEGKALIKGRMTLFVFGERYDYSEFGQMVERRQIPKEWRGHWQFNVVDSYGALVPPRSGEYSLEILVGQQLAGAYIASLGKIPRWFSEGCARAAAAKLDPSDPRVASWNSQLPEALGAMSAADDAINGKLPQEQGDVVNFSFVNFLMSDAKKFNRMLDELRKGVAFDKAFGETYGGSPSQVADAWAKRPAPKARPTKGTPKKAA